MEWWAWLLIAIGILVGIIVLFIAGYWIYMWPASCRSSAKLNGKTVIVTGANAGIGIETALDLAKRGARVILACRNLQKGETAKQYIQDKLGILSLVKVMELDLSSFKSVRQFAKEFHKEERRLDILVNNAGMANYGNAYALSEDGIEIAMAVNHMGHFLLTNLLLDMLKASAPSRVVTVSSLGHTFVSGMPFDDMNQTKNYSSLDAYSYSKLANVLFTRELARRLKDTGVTTYSLHPGAIDTELLVVTTPVLRQCYTCLKRLFFITPRMGAQTSIYCSVDEKLQGVSGRYYSNCKEVQASAAGRDDEAARRLWDISEETTKLRDAQLDQSPTT